MRSKQIGDVIRELRKESKLTQAELCKLAKVSNTQLVLIENNRAFPNKGTLDRIAKQLNVDTYQILSLCIDEESIHKELKIAFKYLNELMCKLIVENVKLKSNG